MAQFTPRSGEGGWGAARADPPALTGAVEVDRPTLVLGRSQPPAHGDRARAQGVAVVHRASGGAAVYVAPGLQAWVDVVVPRDHPQWHEDVGRAAWWIGDAWVAALVELGVAEPVVHRGPMVHGPWSDRVCFAGLAAGEVTVGGRKIVGVAQRRTRSEALFQCAALVRWEPEVVADLTGVPDDLGAVGVGLTELGVAATSDSVAVTFLRILGGQRG